MDTGVTIDITKANKKFKKLLSVAPKQAADIINLAAFELIKLAQTNIMAGPHKYPIQDTGKLAQSLNVGKGSSLIEGSNFVGPVFAEVGSNLPYAYGIEFGSPPHLAPIGQLEKWARRKLGVSNESAGAIARSVQVKIGKEGTKARPYLFPAFEIVAQKLKKGRYNKMIIKALAKKGL
jgi:hypothetical protein